MRGWCVLCLSYHTPKDLLPPRKAGIYPRTDRQFRNRASPTPLRVPWRRQPRLECVSTIYPILTDPDPVHWCDQIPT